VCECCEFKRNGLIFSRFSFPYNNITTWYCQYQNNCICSNVILTLTALVSYVVMLVNRETEAFLYKKIHTKIGSRHQNIFIYVKEKHSGMF